MTVSSNFFKIIKEFEGFVSCPYRDQVGIPTIGIGTTVYPDGEKVSMEDPCITFEEASAYVRVHIAHIEDYLSSQLPDLNQNQFDSLVSFIYNVGLGAFKTSTLLKKARININDPEIRNQFARWNKAGGKTLAGLTRRRKKEAELYFKLI